MKFIMWDQLIPLFNLIAIIPAIIAWHRHHLTNSEIFIAGFYLGGAIYYQFCVMERRRSRKFGEKLMYEMANILASKPPMEEMLEMAENFVEARMKSEHIDPSRN